MATEHGRGPVVVDTDVYSARLIPDSSLALQYEPLLVGRPEFVSFQTVAEVRYGALLRGWGDTRLRRMEAAFGRIEIVYPGPDLIRTYAELRVACQRAGHALSQREHDADRWIAATAIRLGTPLVSNDGVFENTPGLVVETARS
ncbi:MAG: PIN domain-containing protein [Acidimicrobiia bacterium]|nr:PIN domain-containing protein [Acidimicrobiia bacterium]